MIFIKKYKKCLKCKNYKKLEKFYNLKKNKNSKTHMGKQPDCKKCQLKRMKEDFNKLTAAQKILRRRKNTLQEYNLTMEAYSLLCKKQNNVCGICFKKETQVTTGSGKPKLAVDHDKKTGKIRGLLCAQCNQAIGKLRHNIKFLKNAIKYLSKNE